MISSISSLDDPVRIPDGPGFIIVDITYIVAMNRGEVKNIQLKRSKKEGSRQNELQ